jgi:excisionase family DNA binding protein
MLRRKLVHTSYDAATGCALCISRKGARAMTNPRQRTESEPLLTPSEVATLFRVDPKTVTRWAKAGKLTSIRTLGGHRRYRESEVRSLLEGNTNTPAEV